MAEEKIKAKAEKKAKVEAKPEAKPAAKPKPVEKKPEKKPEAKPVKAEAKEAKKVEKAEKKPEAKKPVKKEPVKPKAKNQTELSAEVLQRRKLIKQKVSLPTFRGRFGVRSIRKKSRAKFNKWRKPRGIDIRRRQDDGAWPKTGYSARLDIKGIHPSGFEDVLVRNLTELTALNPKNQAGRIAGTVGKRKRKEMVAKAKELKVRLLNR